MQVLLRRLTHLVLECFWAQPLAILLQLLRRWLKQAVSQHTVQVSSHSCLLLYARVVFNGQDDWVWAGMEAMLGNGFHSILEQHSAAFASLQVEARC
jgi:hypothetical protein